MFYNLYKLYFFVLLGSEFCKFYLCKQNNKIDDNINYFIMNVKYENLIKKE